jgi:HAD superfamily hydrolase (TIGR01549 family)
MLHAVLFDLDNTLLENDVNSFLQGYFPILSEFASDYLDTDHFIHNLMASTQAMIANSDRSLTNRQVFWADFCRRTGVAQEEIEPHFDRFYREHFGRLRPLTSTRPAAAHVVRYCLEQGLKVVIATNPLFPLEAIRQRLAWAGVPAERFEFALVTAYETMHAAKPSAAYYQEILDRIKVRATQALMVGDDWINDIAPTERMGFHTYWLTNGTDDLPDNGVVPDGYGDLDALYGRLAAGWLIAG